MFDISYRTDISSMSFMNQSDVFLQDKFDFSWNKGVVLDLLLF